MKTLYRTSYRYGHASTTFSFLHTQCTDQYVGKTAACLRTYKIHMRIDVAWTPLLIFFSNIIATHVNTCKRDRGHTYVMRACAVRKEFKDPKLPHYLESQWMDMIENYVNKCDEVYSRLKFWHPWIMEIAMFFYHNYILWISLLVGNCTKFRDNATQNVQ